MCALHRRLIKPTPEWVVENLISLKDVDVTTAPGIPGRLVGGAAADRERETETGTEAERPRRRHRETQGRH